MMHVCQIIINNNNLFESNLRYLSNYLPPVPDDFKARMMHTAERFEDNTVGVIDLWAVWTSRDTHL